MSDQTSRQILVEIQEFGSFTGAEQRYIRRSLDVALSCMDAAGQWARGITEAAAIGCQARAYALLDQIRDMAPEDVEPDDATSMLPLLIRISAFDLQQGKLTSFAAYRFLYERLLGAAIRPWLLSGFCAAAAMPCIHPELRAELLQSLTGEELAVAGWGAREAMFFPQWVEKIPVGT